MDFHSLPRRDLQTLCKRNKIPANMTNVAMADALRALPMVEGLEAIAQEYRSPKRAAAAAAGGSPEPPSRSGRRTSTRRQPNAPGSSLLRPRPGAAGRTGSKNEADVEKKMEEEEDEDAEVVAEVGIPNSPATLNTRGRRTRTLIITCVLEGEEGDEEEAEAEKKGEAVPKTPATRATRGRRATTQAKSSMEADETAKKQEEGGAPAVPQTPAASTARRASTRRGTRAAAPPEEASGARSTRYRTRRAAVEEAAELESAARAVTATAASRKKGMWRAKDEDAGVLAGDMLVAGEDGAVGGAAAKPAPEEEVEMFEKEKPSFVDLTTENSLDQEGLNGLQVDHTVEKVPAGAVVGEGEGSDGVDQTVKEEKFGETLVFGQTVEKIPAAGVVVEGEGSDGVDQTVDAEEFGETVSVDPTVPEEGGCTRDSIDRTVEESFDQTVDVQEAPVVESDDPTVEDAPSGDPIDLRVAVEEKPDIAEGPVDQTADVEEAPVVECDDPTVQQSCEGQGIGAPVEVHQTVEDAPSGDPSDLRMMPLAVDMEGALEEFVDQTAAEEEIPKIVVEASVDQTVKFASDPVDFPSEPLASSEVEGLVDPKVQEMEVPVVGSDVDSIDPTVEDDGIAASEGEEEALEDTPMVGLGLEENPDAGTPATLQDSQAAASETLLPAMDVQVYLPAKGGGGGGGGGEEDDEVPGGERKAETEKAVELEQTEKPLMGVPGEHGGGDLFPFGGDQDKENAAVGGAGAQQQQQMEYDSTTSMRKLKAAVKEKIQKVQEMEDRRKKRAALAALDDNCCIMSPEQQCS